ncbi:MAG: hypothetical protein IJX11_02560 [Bacteroidales bacterium]|nr:hypothetical protein [Bacteroidales bacterium]
MKTLRMFGMAMMAVLMGVGFTSCSKDDNPDGNEDFSNEKKLVKLVAKDDESGKDLEVFTFKYDDKGRLTESTCSFDFGEYAWTNHYTWSDNVIMIDDEYAVALENGRVKSNSGDETFTYNDSNRLTKYDTTTITWDGDKIKTISSYVGSNLSFTYGEPLKKGYCPLIPYLIFQYDNLSMAHPELLGVRTKQLPTMIGGILLTYEFDKEGYITKIYLNQSNPMILTWE